MKVWVATFETWTQELRTYVCDSETAAWKACAYHALTLANEEPLESEEDFKELEKAFADGNYKQVVDLVEDWLETGVHCICTENDILSEGEVDLEFDETLP